MKTERKYWFLTVAPYILKNNKVIFMRPCLFEKRIEKIKFDRNVVFETSHEKPPPKVTHLKKCYCEC